MTAASPPRPRGPLVGWRTSRFPPAADVLGRAAETPPTPTLADQELFLDPVANGPTVRARGFFSTAKLIKHAVQVFARVIARFWKGRDHGIYATVVEEVLREFYFTNVGAAVWGTMLRQTEQTFRAAPDGSPRGGRYFCNRLGLLLHRLDQNQKPRPELSIVGHSAGAIYACHLLKYAHAQRGQDLPANFAFKHLLLLAPACDFRLFDTACALTPLPFESFRLFALRDQLESSYWEVPVLYPRSLLYLVSGAFEREADGETGAFDLPLVGMERYYTGTKAYPMPEVERARQFLGAPGPVRQVWSVNAGLPGLNIDSEKHGEFFLTNQGAVTQVMQSVLDVLQK